MPMNRRGFLAGTVAAAASRALGAAAQARSADAPQFTTLNDAWQSAYDQALGVLAANVQTLPRYGKPVLTEGAAYRGIWLDCGPHESLLYRRFRPNVARNSHQCFFELQRADGQLPCNNKVSGTGFGQIQMVSARRGDSLGTGAGHGRCGAAAAGL